MYENTLKSILADASDPSSKFCLFMNQLCSDHKDQITAECIHYYISKRMSQWANAENKDTDKLSSKTKKTSRFYST